MQCSIYFINMNTNKTPNCFTLIFFSAKCAVYSVNKENGDLFKNADLIFHKC